MGLIDSHAHLTYPDFDGRLDEILKRCSAANVDRIITIGTSLSDARRVIELARCHPGRIHAAAGFHPHEADRISAEEFDALATLWREPEVVALGEMGLDYHYDFADRANQREVFERQLGAARKIDKPIIIHCREAFGDCEPILVDHGLTERRVVFHCFTGTAAEAEAIAQRGWRISFTGIVTFPKSTALQTVARDYPADQLMVETDSPYLSPVPIRGTRPNEPSHVVHVAKFLAALRGVGFAELVEQTSANTRAFFGLCAQESGGPLDRRDGS